jgi:3-oxo-5alpha-steroid 4-dehydrogenase
MNIHDAGSTEIAKEATNPGAPDWHSDVVAPLRVDSADDVAWDSVADLVVVGYGGAGVCAALQARELDLSVIAVDRFAGGGATRINGGVFYAGGGTEIQKEAGVADTPEEMFRYLQLETQGVVSDETLRRFCETSAEAAEWLTGHGVRFSSKLYSKKTSYPHTDYSLYHSDNSLAPLYKALAKPAARGHRALVDHLDVPLGYGKGIYDPLRAAADRAGVTFYHSSTVRQLVIDQSGRVVGIRVTQIPREGNGVARYAKLMARASSIVMSVPPGMPGAGLFRAFAERKFAKARTIEQRIGLTRFIRARRGVCLSAGGFIFNRDMVRRYAPKYLMGMPLGTPGDDGSGIRLGQSAGGAVERLGHVSAWRFINPPIAWAEGMLVNRKGERFVNEMLYGASIGMAMVEEHDGASWIIIDDDQRRKAMAQANDEKTLPFQKYPAVAAMLFGSRKSKSLETLARKCGFEPERFTDEVARYNALAEGRRPDPLGKASEDIAIIRTPPFHAINISIDARLAALPVLTLGGLKVDEATGAVLDGGGARIPGLFAAGRNAIGICSNIYVSGLSAADCVFSGRRVASSAAAEP